MKSALKFISIVILLALFSFPARAGGRGVSLLSETEFKDLAVELAPKVQGFESEMSGPAARDYLYWLKNQFRDNSTRTAAQQTVDRLRSLAAIDLGKSNETPVSSRFGTIPTENIQINKTGFTSNSGNGIDEIYRGVISARFVPANAATSTEDHPILAALRYLRDAAIHCNQTFGAAVSSSGPLLAGMDPTSINEAKRIIAQTFDGRALEPYFKNESFKKALNTAIQELYLMPGNAIVKKALLNDFGVTHLFTVYSEIDPVNQQSFAKNWKPAEIEKHLEEDGVRVKDFYQDATKRFPDHFVYHGTSGDSSEGIHFQGAMASGGGIGGEGLYVVSKNNKSFAEYWGGSKEYLMRFPLKEGAKLVDIVNWGEGRRIWEQYQKKTGLEEDYDGFCERYGIQILRYPYFRTDEAFVIKDSNIIGRGEGVNREMQTLSQKIGSIKVPKTDAEKTAFIETLFNPKYGPVEKNSLLEAAELDDDKLIQLYKSASKAQGWWTRYLLSFHPVPEIVHEIIATPESGILGNLAEMVFIQPETAAMEEDLIQMIGKLAAADDDRGLLKVANIFLLPHTAQMKNALRVLIDKAVGVAFTYLPEKAFSKPGLAGGPEEMRLLIDRATAEGNTRVFEMLNERVLNQPHWRTPQGDIFREAVKIPDPETRLAFLSEKLGPSPASCGEAYRALTH